MRIGTWNLDGRWGDEHAKFLERQDCDVWLLTEVSTDVRLHGYQRVVTMVPMAKGRYWSTMLSRPGLEEQDGSAPNHRSGRRRRHGVLVIGSALADMRR